MAAFRILALDPGGTTGWAAFTADRIIHLEDSGKCEYRSPIYTCGQLEDKEHFDQLATLLGHMHVEFFRIVYETFEYRAFSRAGLDLSAPQYIGVIKQFCQERAIPAYPQSASLGKIGRSSFVKKGNLKKLGLWSSAFPHAMDAYGHLLYYMINGNGGIMREELLAKGWR